MKKIVIMFILLFVSFLIIGCDGNKTEEVIPNEEVEEVVEVVPFWNTYVDPNKDALAVKIDFDEEVGNTVCEEVTNQNQQINYVFNNAIYQNSSDPKRIYGSAISGYALSFDGYSTYISTPVSDSLTTSQLTIDVFVCPRSFEWDDPNAKNGGYYRPQSIVSTLNTDWKTGFQLGMYKYGDYVFQLGLGDRIVDLWNENFRLNKYKWNHITCVWNGDTGKMAMYNNGVLIASRDDAFGTLTHTNEQVYIGRSYQPDYQDSFEVHMFNGVMDELRIYTKELSDEDIKKYHESYYIGENIRDAYFNDVWLDESVFDEDKLHPAFHATPPQHWMNEPHALFYYNGYYHMFYQFNLTGPYWRQICWGHWVSTDMVNWKNVKEAIVMDDVSPVRDGAWSGCASYKQDGTPVLFVTAGDDARVYNSYSNQNIVTAVPKDLSDPYLTEWIVSDELCAELTPDMGKESEFRDPNIYYEDGTYYMLVGSSTHDSKGTAQIFTTTDDSFENWEYKGYLFEAPKYETYMGTCWELTNLVKVYNADKTISKYLFAFSPAGANMDNDVFYYLGDFDKNTCRFIPETEKPLRMDYGNNVFTGPTISVDPVTGRVLICSILQDQRYAEDHYKTGWAHQAGIPRELSLDNNGNLMISPLKELDNLKGDILIEESNISVSDLNSKLAKITDTQVYIKLSVENIDSNTFNLYMKESGGIKTSFIYNFKNKVAAIDTTATGFENRVKGVFGDRVPYSEDGKLEVEIFIDKGIIEIYVNGYNTITAMAYDIYPKMTVKPDKNIKINRIVVRKMNSI